MVALGFITEERMNNQFRIDMKKLVLFLVSAILLTVSTRAQNCTPDRVTQKSDFGQRRLQ